MNFGATDHPFYKPKWRRQAIVAATAIWAIVELTYGSSGFWRVISVGVWAYCFWVFMWTWKDAPPPGK
jgi:hypothetical protein